MISITGLKEIDAVLKNLPNALSHKVIGSANFAAAKPLVLKEKLTAPEGPTGNLVDSIGATRSSYKKATELGEVKVGPRQSGKYKGFHGYFNEAGTGPRETTGKKSLPAGLDRGKMTGKPFAKPAFDATKGQIEGIIKEELAKSVVRTMKKSLGNSFIK